MNLLGKLQNEYDQLWKQIIRPPRSHYSQQTLGPKEFALEGQNIRREDFQLMNLKGLVYQVSVWIPQNIQGNSCIIYLHGSDGNRTQGMQYLGKVLKCGFALCTFDFCGCGNAQGEFISMGYFQQDQLSDIVSHLKSKLKMRSICLWGKYLGAVTAMLYMAKTKQIKAAVFDNPYKNVKSVIEEMVKQTKIPSLVAGGAVKMISKTIQDKGEFDLHNVNPHKYVAFGLDCPAFFVVSTNDQIINLEHTKDLYAAYAGEQKHLCLIKGKVSDSRSQQCVNDCCNFFLKYLGDSQPPKRQQKSQKEFDFFEMRKNMDQDKEEEQTNQQKQTNVDFFAEEHQKPSFQKPENDKPNNQFSLKGLISIFTKEQQPKKEPREEKESQRLEEEINDKYTELRRRLALNHKETNITKGINQQRMQKLTEKMRKQLYDARQSFSDKGSLKNWVLVSL